MNSRDLYRRIRPTVISVFKKVITVVIEKLGSNQARSSGC